MFPRIKEIRGLLRKYTKERAFLELISAHFSIHSSDYRLIAKADKVAEEEFAHIHRKGNGKLYIEHLRAVAIIVLVYLCQVDARLIAACLLHDILEDIKGWNYNRLVREFGSDVAEIVLLVSKPDLCKFKGNKTKRDNYYFGQLNNAIRVVIILKLADTLHNMITLWGLDKDKQDRKINQVKTFYMNLAIRHCILTNELKEALKEIGMGQRKKSHRNRRN